MAIQISQGGTREESEIRYYIIFYEHFPPLSFYTFFLLPRKPLPHHQLRSHEHTKPERSKRENK